MDLTEKSCEPCGGGVEPLGPEEARSWLERVPDWELTDDGTRIERTYAWPAFLRGIEFVDRVAELAEAEGHHPDIHVHWRKVRLELWTHAIGGLHENDFILAAKADAIADEMAADGQG